VPAGIENGVEWTGEIGNDRLGGMKTMAGIGQPNVDSYELFEDPNHFGGGSGTALLTPDIEKGLESDGSGRWSDYPGAGGAAAPWCGAGDDLDDDEAYFLEDEDDDDPDDADLEDDFDDDDFDDEEVESDSDIDSDDEDL
jgi:hypothetical protein